MRPGPARGGAPARAVDRARLRLDPAARASATWRSSTCRGTSGSSPPRWPGSGPVPVVMFVVAADDPWMPQAAEHLAALDALGVDTGVLVVTRSDLADPAPALARARDELARTSLRGAAGRRRERPHRCGPRRAARPAGRGAARHAPARPGRRRAALGRPAVPRPRRRHGRHRHAPGRAPSASATPSRSTAGPAVRVRGLECARARAVDEVAGVARVALDLGRPGARAPHPGHGPDDARRVRAGRRGRRTAARGGRLPPSDPMLHVGSTAVAVHARPLADDLRPAAARAAAAAADR